MKKTFVYVVSEGEKGEGEWLVAVFSKLSKARKRMKELAGPGAVPKYTARSNTVMLQESNGVDCVYLTRHEVIP